jgi:hypothetical protein
MATTTSTQVQTFIAACNEAGFTYSTKPGLVSVRRSFTPGDAATYCTCDNMGPRLLSLVPIVAAGSVWGTDGATVGGAVALRDGHYRLTVSGASKRFTTALAKA